MSDYNFIIAINLMHNHSGGAYRRYTTQTHPTSLLASFGRPNMHKATFRIVCVLDALWMCMMIHVLLIYSGERPTEYFLPISNTVWMCALQELWSWNVEGERVGGTGLSLWLGNFAICCRSIEFEELHIQWVRPNASIVSRVPCDFVCEYFPYSKHI